VGVAEPQAQTGQVSSTQGLHGWGGIVGGGNNPLASGADGLMEVRW